MESLENEFCGILEKYCEDEGCDIEDFSGLKEVRIVESIWLEAKNLRSDIEKKFRRDEIEGLAGYLLFLDDGTGVILIDMTYFCESHIKKDFCWIETLIHEATHYRDFKNNLGILGHNTYDSMLNCRPFWYWTEFHARYKGTLHMLDFVNGISDEVRRNHETGMIERLSSELDYITSDADKKIRCYHFMHLLADIAAYKEKGYKIQSDAIENIFPNYLDYIENLKSKNNIVDADFLIMLQYRLDKDIS